MTCAKIQPQGILGSGRFLRFKGFYQIWAWRPSWSTDNLAIFCFLTLRWLHMKFEQNWLRGFRGEVVWNSQQFSHSNVWGSYKCIGKQTWPCRKKVKRKRTTILLATLVGELKIWANLAQWLQRRSRLKFSTIFLFKCMGLIQMHREANLTLP